jgi:hypothetical protein
MYATVYAGLGSRVGHLPNLLLERTKSTEPMASPSTGWTGSNRACVTIGSRDALRTPALVSAISFGSHSASLTRYTSPPQTVGNSGQPGRASLRPCVSRNTTRQARCPTAKGLFVLFENRFLPPPPSHLRAILVSRPASRFRKPCWWTSVTSSSNGC